jgi:hypothetical protein
MVMTRGKLLDRIKVGTRKELKVRPKEREVALSATPSKPCLDLGSEVYVEDYMVMTRGQAA